MSEHDLRKAATSLVNDIANLIGGPIATKDDAIKRAADALRISYLSGYDAKRK